MSTGQLFYDPYPRPLSSVGASLPLGYYNFLVSGSTTPAAVYQDAAITLPYAVNSAGQYIVTADGTGTMPLIFLNPALIYRVQLFNQFGQLLEDCDPYIPPLPGFGNGPITFNAQGEMTIAPPASGGIGVTVTIFPRSGAQALRLVGTSAGEPTLIANGTVFVGSQTATFAATNKPGSGTTAPAKWLPIQCDSATYYIPLWL